MYMYHQPLLAYLGQLHLMLTYMWTCQLVRVCIGGHETCELTLTYIQVHTQYVTGFTSHRFHGGRKETLLSKEDTLSKPSLLVPPPPIQLHQSEVTSYTGDCWGLWATGDCRLLGVQYCYSSSEGRRVAFLPAMIPTFLDW